MRIGACGMACELCVFLKKGICMGCNKGTDEAAVDKLNKFKDEYGFFCKALECAVTNRIDCCLSCENMPCDLLYQEEVPYSRKMINEGFKPLKNRLNE